MENTATGRALLARGELRQARLAVLDILEARGLPVPDGVKARLERETDLALLREALRAAVRVGPDLAGLFPD